MTRWAKASQSVPYSTKGYSASTVSRPWRTCSIHSVRAGTNSGADSARSRSSVQRSSWTSGKAVAPLSTRPRTKKTNQARMPLRRAALSLMAGAYAYN